MELIIEHTKNCRANLPPDPTRWSCTCGAEIQARLTIKQITEYIEDRELFTNYSGDFRAMLVSELKATN